MTLPQDIEGLKIRMESIQRELLIHRSELDKLRDIPDSLSEIKTAVMNVDTRLKPLEALAMNIKTIKIVIISVAIGYCLNVITTNPVVAKAVLKLISILGGV